MFSLLFRSLWYDRWINTAVVFGVLCATAVLTGALLVGDSMRGSLKALTLDRLGNIDTILFAQQFIEKRAGDCVAVQSEDVILLPAAVEFNGKVSGVQLLGSGTECIVNQALADKIGIQAGETLSLRLMSPQSIPPESSLGRKDQLIRSRIRVDEIIPNRGLGRFSLKMDQQAEPLLIVPLAWLQRRLDVGDKVNAVTYRTDTPHTPFSAAQREAWIEKTFQPTWSDLGITIDSRNGKHYIKSTRMLFTDEQADAIRESLCPSCLCESKDFVSHEGTKDTKFFSEGLLYLATVIRAGTNETPYSTVYACSSLELHDHEIALNRWTADDLGVELGDEIELTWFDPHDVTITHSKSFTLAKILPMDGFLGADPLLVPEVQGFTDEVAIADWDPPFPFDAKKIRQKDEDYWDKYKAAPKAFVSLATGQELFGSRFGKITTFVVDKSRNGAERNDGEQPAPPSLHCVPFRLLLPSETFGITFVPVKEQGLAASSGTTPFSVLFLSFSFFIIASALMLVMLLFRLSVEMKAKRIGIQLAVGWSAGLVTKTLLAEGLLLSLFGSLFGTFFGIFYAWLMVHGLTTWWVDAVTVPFLTLHIQSSSLVIGFLSGVLLSVLTIFWSVRGIAKVPLQALLHGVVERRQTADGRRQQRAGDCVAGEKEKQRSPQNPRKEFIIVSIIIAVNSFAILYSSIIGLYVLGVQVLFFGLLIPYRTLTVTTKWRTNCRFTKSLAGLAQTNIIRNKTRSLLCVGLVASTTFLVLSISAFRLDETNESQKHWGGTGRFVYMGETMFPVHSDIGTVEGRERLGIQSDDEKYLQEQKYFSVARDRFISCRVKSGISASCLNLYQATNPRIIGFSQRVFDHNSRFSFVRRSPFDVEFKTLKPLWQPTTLDSDGVRRVPVVIDVNTAMYALQLRGSIGEVYEYDDGAHGIIRCEIVGLLTNSILQGEIVMSEENLLTLFPETSGYQFFLFDSPDISTRQPLDDRTLRIIYDLLGDYGFQGEPTADRLRKLFAVQNTYLSTFQSLGGIGLLLGIFGLAVIQSRNVLERRKELALLLAMGFTKSRVILLLLYESFTLLGWGLGLAVVASAFALFPFFIGGVQQVSVESILWQFVVLVGGMLLIGIVSNVASATAVLKIPVARELAEER